MRHIRSKLGGEGSPFPHQSTPFRLPLHHSPLNTGLGARKLASLVCSPPLNPVPSIWLLCSRIRAHAPGCHASIASIASSPIHSITHRCLCFDPLPIHFPLLPFCLISRAPMLKTPGSPTPIASTSQTTACTMPRQSSPHWEPLTVGDVECWV